MKTAIEVDASTGEYLPKPVKSLFINLNIDNTAVDNSWNIRILGRNHFGSC